MPERKLKDEPGRLRALQRYQILDSEKEKPFEKIVGLVAQILKTPICAVSLLDTDRQWFKSQCGLPVDQTARDISFCTHAVMHYEPFIIRDALNDSRFAENPLVTGPPDIRSYVGVPLTTPDGYNVGTLCAIDTVPREFPPSEVDIIKNFAALVVDEMELRMTASTDVLTGALSRRAWTQQAEEELARARRHDRDLSVALFDLDHFKSVNDTHGHGVGDRVLQMVSAAVSDVLRSGQSFGRLGGEEFVVLLPECDEASGCIAAERFREKIETAQVTDETGAPLPVTASFGVAHLTADITAVEELLSRADKALYRAKSKGRNRVSQFGDVTLGDRSADAVQQPVPNIASYS